MRSATIRRKTNETDIALTLNLDGSGRSDVKTGVGFLDHMLTLFAGHGRFDLNVSCKGDTNVDDHHSVEDVGIALGEAFRQALGEKKAAPRKARKSAGKDADTVALEKALSDAIGLKVTIDHRANGTGELRIRYLNLEQLDDICRRLQ